MAELDTIAIYNPLKEDFQCRFNGQVYRVEAQSSKHFPQFLAFHVAKHLSDAILQPELVKIKKTAPKENSFNPKNAQLMIYDNVERRIALYDILQNKSLVQTCISQFPLKGFIGNVKVFDDYVAKAEAPKESKTKAKAPVETAPAA
jgi:hypothetical protein